jgi:uncharacterized membrane protein YfcA
MMLMPQAILNIVTGLLFSTVGGITGAVWLSVLGPIFAVLGGMYLTEAIKDYKESD